MRDVALSIVSIAAIVAGPAVAAEVTPQAASALARPKFDVVSIKQTRPGTRGNSFGRQPGGRWRMMNRSIGTLIRAAYPAQVSELVGAPAWVATDPYDVDARAEGNPTQEQIRLMLQTLLAERFTLIAHYEMRDVPIYALVIARKDGRPGAGLVPSKLDCEAVNAARRAGRTPEGPVPSNGAPPCAWASEWSANGPVTRFGGLPLSRLAESLGQPDGRVIIDKTGLEGNYELTLRYTTQPTATDDIPSLFTALEEQLGLKLVKDDARLEVLVVDRIERPTEN